jgi:hypothetical protein
MDAAIVSLIIQPQRRLANGIYRTQMCSAVTEPTNLRRELEFLTRTYLRSLAISCVRQVGYRADIIIDRETASAD